MTEEDKKEIMQYIDRSTEEMGIYLKNQFTKQLAYLYNDIDNKITELAADVRRVISNDIWGGNINKISNIAKSNRDGITKIQTVMYSILNYVSDGKEGGSPYQEDQEDLLQKLQKKYNFKHDPRDYEVSEETMKKINQARTIIECKGKIK